MNYWLICLPKPDLEHCIKVGTFGLARKHLIDQVKEGDKIVCCAGKGDWKIIATGEATADYYVDDKKLFLKEGLFPDRFDFQASALSTPIDLMTVIDQLSFVTNLAYWAVYFRSGIARISKDDWKVLTANTSPSAVSGHH